MRHVPTNDESLRSVFLASSAAHAERTALEVGGAAFTYRELSVRARQIAAALASALAEPPARVGVFGQRSLTTYAGTLGALCAGAAFVPLNPGFPTARSAGMATRAKLDAIVVDRLGAALLPDVLADLESTPVIVHVDAEAGSALLAAGIASVQATTFAPLVDLPCALPDDIAYLLFTSGSTGTPKGVGVTHANALHYLSAMQRRLQLTPADRCSQTFDATFDLSVHDMFLAWSAGACVVAMQPIDLLAPVRFVSRNRISVWFSVPSVAALALKKKALRPGAMPGLRLSLFCGEPLPVATTRAWQEAAPASVVENLYGPTELTIACFAYRWNGGESSDVAVNGIVPIGRALPGLGSLVVDELLRPVPDGVAGELLVCGPQTVPGYWLDPARTDERFVRLPTSSGDRFYRTGDLVVRLNSGDHAFLGRVDQQIKVMGYRVEPGEIEAVLLRDCGAVQAVAAGWPVQDGHALGIVAFVSGATKTTEDILGIARSLLPAYMVPSRVFVLDEMPLNASGKVDRAQLVAGLDAVIAA